MVSLRFLFVFASAVTAIPTLSRRDPQQILQDLQGIDTSVKSMTQAVQGWSGSLIAALSIKSQADNVGTQVDTASQAAQGEPQANTQDSQMILDFVTQTLTPDIQACMNALTQQKPNFDKDSLSGLVSSTLQDIQQRDTLTTSLVQMASPDLQQAAKQAADGVNAAFASALQTFSG